MKAVLCSVGLRLSLTMQTARATVCLTWMETHILKFLILLKFALKVVEVNWLHSKIKHKAGKPVLELRHENVMSVSMYI